MQSTIATACAPCALSVKSFPARTGSSVKFAALPRKLRGQARSTGHTVPRRAARPAVLARAAAAAPAVRIAEERLEAGKVRLSVTIPAEVCQAEYRKVLDVYRKEVNVPGFRKGKAPNEVLVKHLGGQGAVNNSVLAELLEPAMVQAMEGYQSEVLADSEQIEEDGERMGARFDPKSDFTFQVTFDTMPQISWRQPYRELVVTVEEAGNSESDAAAVEEKLRALRKDKATLRVASGRGVQRGDVAIVDLDAADAATGEPLPNAEAKGRQLHTDVADSTFLPGIVDAMLGMTVGETRTAPLTFPDSEFFQPASLRGVTASVTITLTELFEEELPELTDEWAESLQPGIGGVAGMHALLKENQAEETAEATQRAIVDAITGAVAAAVVISYVPRSMVEEAGRKRYSSQLSELMQGGLPYETVQQLTAPQLVSQFIDRKWDELVELQKAVMGFEDILAKEGLAATPEEIEAEMQVAVAQFQQYSSQYDEAALREQVTQTLETNKVMEWLKANINLTVLPYASTAST